MNQEEIHGKKLIQDLKSLQSIIWNLKEENIDKSVQSVLYDSKFLNSFNIVLCKLVYQSIA